MTLPPFPFVPASPEERLRLTQYGELVRAMALEEAAVIAENTLEDLIGKHSIYGAESASAIRDAARSGGKGDGE